MEQVIGRTAPNGAPAGPVKGVALGTGAAAPEAQGERAGLRPSVLSLTIREKGALYASYMRFVDGGGLFVPTSRPARLGDEVYAMVTLLEDATRVPIPGKVCWITPAGVPGRPQGIGVQFAKNEAGEQARNTIEKLIGSALSSDRATQTI